MASEKLPDLDALAAELVQLERRQRELLSRHDKITDRLMAFPNEVGRRQAEALAREITANAARIDEIQVQLVPIRRIK